MRAFSENIPPLENIHTEATLGITFVEFRNDVLRAVKARECDWVLEFAEAAAFVNDHQPFGKW